MSTFWGIVLLPGNPASPPPSPWNLNVTSVALSADYIAATSNSDGEQTTLQVRVGGDMAPWMTLATLSPSDCTQWSLGHVIGPLDGRVTFRAQGAATLHLTGYSVPDIATTPVPASTAAAAALEASTAPAPRAAATAAAPKAAAAAANGEAATRQQRKRARKASAAEADEVSSAASTVAPVEEAEAATVEAKPDVTNSAEEVEAEAEAEAEAESKKKKKKRKKKVQEVEGNEFAALRSLGPGRNSAGLAGVGQSVRNPKPRHLGGGLSVKDTMIGTGPPAPLGRTVKLLYEGTLKDGTVFDKKDKARSPFTFRLGLREVVAGMDKGVEGMKVGGHREIKIPPAMGYGNKAVGPIPPNSTLTFKVELIAIV